MRADLIDIQVEDHGDDVEITLSGSLGSYQLAAVREKIDFTLQALCDRHIEGSAA